MKLADIIVPILLVLIIMSIIVPMPLFLVDFALAINISLALLILLIAMFLKEPLEFSVFPSILLITTLFRLALNITTTRYILSDGQAGNVIEAFGQFAIRGDAVVGFIIFLIIIIVQFLVITKGSERVSEVAARFTLDAMPGKQMAIDADLNSGLITEAEARKKRKTIQGEADFYGAMDGASKFVKGDAIAGILITIINILAGLSIGAIRFELSIAEALQKYTLLTVGDGLVSQIPALMISTATGIVVTRAASDSDLGTDAIRELFNQPIVMFIIAGVLFLLGFTPLPILPFNILALVFLYLGFLLRREVTKAVDESQAAEEEEMMAEEEKIKSPENIMPLLEIDPIELEFGYGVIPLADPNQGGDLFDRLVMIRRQIALELGIVVPMIRLRDNIQLESNEYIIKINGNLVASGSIMFDHFLAMNPGTVEGEIDGIDTVEPAFGLPAKWVSSDDRENAEILGYTVVDPSSMMSTHLTEVIKRYSYELLGRQETKNLIDNVSESNPTVVSELIPNIMSVGDVQKVLKNLLRERVSIRNLVRILETLADYGNQTGDVNVLTEYVRQGLSRQISEEYFPGKQGKIITFNQALENQLMESIEQNAGSSYLALDPSTSQRLINGIATELQNLVRIGEEPILLTAPIVRFYIKQLTEQSLPDLIVLSYNEIENDINLESAGMVEI
ncbi:MAG TPA: flagellar biosynthesis protein FlhA [Clostridia bacterium]|nr:flagellar biosynthesis protein FlhA [Clostridia bacterium]